MKQIDIKYIRVNGNWTFEITNLNSGLKTTGDLYPGTKRGLEEVKRDSAAIVRHLRKTNKIKVMR